LFYNYGVPFTKGMEECEDSGVLVNGNPY
jgi:hypothetical protein